MKEYPSKRGSGTEPRDGLEAQWHPGPLGWGPHGLLFNMHFICHMSALVEKTLQSPSLPNDLCHNANFTLQGDLMCGGVCKCHCTCVEARTCGSQFSPTTRCILGELESSDLEVIL